MIGNKRGHRIRGSTATSTYKCRFPNESQKGHDDLYWQYGNLNTRRITISPDPSFIIRTIRSVLTTILVSISNRYFSFYPIKFGSEIQQHTLYEIRLYPILSCDQHCSGNVDGFAISADVPGEWTQTWLNTKSFLHSTGSHSKPYRISTSILVWVTIKNIITRMYFTPLSFKIYHTYTTSFLVLIDDYAIKINSWHLRKMNNLSAMEWWLFTATTRVRKLVELWRDHCTWGAIQTLTLWKTHSHH